MSSTVDTREAARLTGLAEGTLANLRVRGGGPKFLKLGRAVRYSRSAIDAWLAAHEVSSTSEQAAA